MRREASERIREMRTQELPWWLLLEGGITGHDGDDDDDDDSDEDENDNDEDDNDDEDDSDDDEKSKKPKGADTDALKSALRKERSSRRAMAKELKALKKRLPPEPKDDKDKDKPAEAPDTKELDEATSRADKLATKLRVSAEDNIIIRLASTLGFRDADDAVALVNRREFDVDQDDEDPTEIDIDAESIEDALKKLLKAKPHLKKPKEENSEEEDEEEPPQPKSGGKFGGKKAKKDRKAQDEEFASHYPALRGIPINK